MYSSFLPITIRCSMIRTTWLLMILLVYVFVTHLVLS